MYSLYDIYGYNRDKILNSIGLEYSQLNINDLRMLLIYQLQTFKLLELDSNNVVLNDRFWNLIQLNQEQLTLSPKYNSNMYEIDLILLEINEDSATNIIDFPDEIIIHILSYTGSKIESHDKWDAKVYELRDVYQLYNTSKRFQFLDKLYYCSCKETEYEFFYTTTDIFGNWIGPSYRTMSFYDDISSGISGYTYKGNSTISSTNVYVSMCLREGILVVNNLAYKYTDDVVGELCEQIHDQIDKIDPIIKQFIFNEPYIQGCDRQQPLLIRSTIPNNNYIISIDNIDLIRESDKDKYISEYDQIK